jgi:hypothetical protein
MVRLVKNYEEVHNPLPTPTPPYFFEVSDGITEFEAG